jgi:aspartate/methionine/tyrosine aminotransferase
MQKANRIQNISEYYFSYKLREVRELIDNGLPIINLGIGNPDLPPPTHVVNDMIEASSDLTKQGYQAYKGIPELRKAIGYFYKEHYQVLLNSDTDILPLTGSKEGVMHISMAFLNAGDKVLIPNPGYVTYTSITKLLDAKPIYYNLKASNQWFPDFDELEKHDLSNVKLMWVNYPNMPTGAKPSNKLFKKLISFAKKHHILIVNDNPYSFILNETPMSILAIEGAKEVALEINSLSKSFNMAGWRVGMLVGSDAHINAVLKVKSNMDSGMYYGLQKGAIAALKTDKGWFTLLNKTYADRRDILWKIIDKLGYSYEKDTSGLFVWAKLPKNQKSEAVTDYLLKEKHIFVTPGHLFGSNGEGYMRFSLCVEQNKLKEVLERC